MRVIWTKLGERETERERAPATTTLSTDDGNGNNGSRSSYAKGVCCNVRLFGLSGGRLSG